jgi:large subunit ribosomal protein L29
MKENADKARGLDTAEINKQLRDSAEQMFRLRFQLRMGQMEGLKKLRVLRKERARMLTVLRERELHPEGVAPKPAAKKVKAAKSKPPVASKAPVKSQAPAKPKAAAKAKASAKPKAAAKAPAKTKAAAKATKKSKG